MARTYMASDIATIDRLYIVAVVIADGKQCHAVSTIKYIVCTHTHLVGLTNSTMGAQKKIVYASKIFHNGIKHE